MAERWVKYLGDSVRFSPLAQYQWRFGTTDAPPHNALMYSFRADLISRQGKDGKFGYYMDNIHDPAVMANKEKIKQWKRSGILSHGLDKTNICVSLQTMTVTNWAGTSAMPHSTVLAIQKSGTCTFFISLDPLGGGTFMGNVMGGGNFRDPEILARQVKRLCSGLEKMAKTCLGESPVYMSYNVFGLQNWKVYYHADEKGREFVFMQNRDVVNYGDSACVWNALHMANCLVSGRPIFTSTAVPERDRRVDVQGRIQGGRRASLPTYFRVPGDNYYGQGSEHRCSPLVHYANYTRARKKPASLFYGNRITQPSERRKNERMEWLSTKFQNIIASKKSRDRMNLACGAVRFVHMQPYYNGPHDKGVRVYMGHGVSFGLEEAIRMAGQYAREPLYTDMYVGATAEPVDDIPPAVLETPPVKAPDDEALEADDTKRQTPQLDSPERGQEPAPRLPEQYGLVDTVFAMRF